jgi:hypothetical protein
LPKLATGSYSTLHACLELIRMSDAHALTSGRTLPLRASGRQKGDVVANRAFIQRFRSAPGTSRRKGITVGAAAMVATQALLALPFVGLAIVAGWTPSFEAAAVSQFLAYKQHLDNLRRKDSLRGAETAEISVRLGNYSASHFEGSAYTAAGTFAALAISDVSIVDAAVGGILVTGATGLFRGSRFDAVFIGSALFIFSLMLAGGAIGRLFRPAASTPSAPRVGWFGRLAQRLLIRATLLQARLRAAVPSLPWGQRREGERDERPSPISRWPPIVRLACGYPLTFVGTSLALTGFFGLFSILFLPRYVSSMSAAQVIVLMLSLAPPSALCLWAGYRLRIVGKRFLAEHAELLLASDQRAPVLYLRPFGEDTNAPPDRKPLSTRSVGIPGAASLLFFPFALGKSDEEELCSAVSQIGPFVAVGRPGEKLPQLGAARLYVPNEEWHDTIDRLLDKACVVVLRVGLSMTEGFWWEVDRVWQRVSHERVLFWFPFGTTIDAKLDRGRRFSERFEGKFGVKIPELRAANFLHFARDGTPVVSQPRKLESRSQGGESDLAQQLQPYFQSLGFDFELRSAFSIIRVLQLFVLVPLLLVTSFAIVASVLGLVAWLVRSFGH